MQGVELARKLRGIKIDISNKLEILQHRMQQDSHLISLAATSNHVTPRGIHKTRQPNFCLKLLDIKPCRNRLYLRRLAQTAISQIVKTQIMATRAEATRTRTARTEAAAEVVKPI
jgi:hypothetical protein